MSSDTHPQGAQLHANPTRARSDCRCNTLRQSAPERLATNVCSRATVATLRTATTFARPRATLWAVGVSQLRAKMVSLRTPQPPALGWPSERNATTSATLVMLAMAATCAEGQQEGPPAEWASARCCSLLSPLSALPSYLHRLRARGDWRDWFHVCPKRAWCEAPPFCYKTTPYEVTVVCR